MRINKLLDYAIQGLTGIFAASTATAIGATAYLQKLKSEEANRYGQRDPYHPAIRGEAPEMILDSVDIESTTINDWVDDMAETLKGPIRTRKLDKLSTTLYWDVCSIIFFSRAVKANYDGYKDNTITEEEMKDDIEHCRAEIAQAIYGAKRTIVAIALVLCDNDEDMSSGLIHQMLIELNTDIGDEVAEANRFLNKIGFQPVT